MTAPRAFVEAPCPVCRRVDWRSPRSAEARALVEAAGLPPNACGGCAITRLAEIGAAALRAAGANPTEKT